MVLACAALVVASAVRPAAPVSAAELKPVAVVSIAGYDALLNDVGLIGDIAGAPELKQGIEGLIGMVTRFQGLAGLSKDKPLGGALLLNEESSPSGYVFLPVSDVEKLLDVFQDTVITDVEEDEDEKSVSKLSLKNGPPLYLKVSGGWAFVTPKKEFLADLPKDPAALLGDLPESYDVAVKINIANVPEPLLDMALGQMKAGAEQAMRRAAEENPEAAKIQQEFVETYLEQVSKALKELESYTVGLAISDKTRSAYLDVEAVMKDGSDMAKQVNASAAAAPTSKLPGLADAARVFNLHLNAPVLESDAEQVAALIDQARASIEEKIKEEIDEEEEQKAVTKWANTAIDVVKATIEAGQINGGAVVTGEGPFSVVVAAHVVDAKKLDKLFREIAKVAADKSEDAPEFEFDADEKAGVTFHTFALPIDEDDDTEDLEKFFGTDEPTAALGFGKEVVVLSIGEDPVAAAAEVLSKKGGGAKLPMMQAQLKFGPIMKVAADQSGDEQPLLPLAAELLKGEKKDHINLTASFIKNGERVRLEIEEGLIAAFGKLAMQATKGGR